MFPEKVKPELPAGFRDMTPEDMILRRFILTTLISVFERYGFEPFSSSTVQFLSVLFGSDEWTDMAYYRVHNTRRRDRGGRADTGLKFDQTVALGRFVAEYYEELPRPFLRYEIGQAYRGEKPTMTRFCEFTQCDVDMIFAPGMISDAQIIALMDECFRALGVTTHRVLLNNRKILNGLAERIGFSPDYLNMVLGVLDKLDKLEEGQTLESELVKLKRDDDSLLLVEQQIRSLVEFGSFTGTSGERLMALRAFMRGIPSAEEGCTELEEVLRYLTLFGVDSNRIQVTPTMVRGLGYYTGPIFETILTDAPEMGSMFSGGRYDNLVERFVEMPAKATGAAFGLDRFMVYAKERGLYQLPTSIARIMVTYRPANGCKERAIEVTQILRAKGHNTVLYDGDNEGLRPQIGRAKQLGIPWVVIIGEGELTSGLVTLKPILAEGQKPWQETLAMAKLLEKLT